MIKMNRLMFGWLLMVWLGIVTLAPNAQETQLAAALEITYPTVEIQLANSARSLTLPRRAVTPLGVGDDVVVTEFGRAYLTVVGRAEAVILPLSRFRLDALPQVAQTSVGFAATLDGVGVFRINSRFEISARAFTLQSAEENGPAHFAVWSQRASAITVAAASGSVEIVTEDGEWVRVNAGEVVRLLDDEVQRLVLDAPLNRARLIAALEGCPGVVRITTDAPFLTVRAGAGTFYAPRGALDDGVEVQLLGRTASGGWTRLQFGNGFGWVISNAIRTDCPLPRLPDAAREQPIRAIEPIRPEANLLAPFFADATFDEYFFALTFR